MSLFSMLKNNSKAALKGNWSAAITVLLLVVAISMVISGVNYVISVVFSVPTWGMEEAEYESLSQIFSSSLLIIIIEIIISVISFFLLAPLQLGLIRWHFALVDTECLPFSTLFYYFDNSKNYLKSLAYSLQIGIRSSLWSLLFLFAPLSIMGVSLYFISENGDRAMLSTSTMAFFISIGLVILATIIFVIFIGRYTLVPYLISENPDIKVNDAFKISIKYMKGYKCSIMLFELSFIGWLCLSLASFGLGILYVSPYLNTSLAMYAKYIMYKNREQLPAGTREFNLNDEY